MEIVTVREIAEAIEKSIRYTNMLATEKRWPHEAVNGRGDRRFYIDQLPPEIQERIARARMGLDPRTGLGDLEEMVKSCSIRIDPAKLRDPRAAGKIRMVCECLAVPPARGREARIREIAEYYGYTRATAYRLMRRARSGRPLEASTRNWGHEIQGLGITVRSWDPEAAELAIQSIAGNRHEKAEKLSLYIRIAEEARAKCLRIGSYESFCSIASRLSPAMLKFRDMGARGLREDVVPAIRRDHTAYRVMECLVGDQHKADYYCLDASGQIVTLELFCWMDFRSQMTWGSIAYKHYNRYTVGQALINAVRWGLPSLLYTDWGKPEQSDYISHLIEQLSGLGIQHQGIHQINATVRNPQAKPIEGWFGRLDARLKNEHVPGYSKRLADGRENELNQKHIKEEVRAGDLWSIEEITRWLIGHIDQANNHIFKNRGCDNGKSPLEIYNELTAEYPVTTLSDDMLDYVFLPVQRANGNGKPLRVKRSQVRIRHPWLGTLHYYSPDLSGHGGEEVEVRFHPYDQSRVWVFEGKAQGARHKAQGGGLICTATEWGMINPKCVDQVSEKMEAKRSLEKQIRDEYAKWAPPKKRPLRKIVGAERQARAMSESIRVMQTPLDEEPIRQVAAAGNVVDIRTGEVVEEPERIPFYMRNKRAPETGYCLPFTLKMGCKRSEDDDEE